MKIILVVLEIEVRKVVLQQTSISIGVEIEITQNNYLMDNHSVIFSFNGL